MIVQASRNPHFFPPSAAALAAIRQRAAFSVPDTGSGIDTSVYEAPPAMRRPRTRAPEAPPALPPLGVVALSRAGFGPRPGDLAAFAALGGDDDARLTAWVDQQLAPAAIVDTDCDNRLASSGYQTLNKTLQQLWSDHFLSEQAETDWYWRILPALDTELAAWTRAVYSKRQLLEVVADFWHNHFNVYAWEFVESPVWAHYDRDVIRANAFGNFRTMLGAVAKSPAMLVYLDNFINFASELDDETPVGSNENYARELIELHCLGAVVSHGNTAPEDIPVDQNGVPVGYCQADVVAAARALTGWTFDIEWIWPLPGTTGAFTYHDPYHDKLPKTVLGLTMAGGRGLEDGEDLLDRLASHPACGRFIATKLCRRLIGDFPPGALVDSAAALFTAQWQAPDQLRQVIRHILLANQFRTTWGEKIKRPFEIAVSALRAADAEFRFTWEDNEDGWDNGSLHWLYEAGGQAIFGWHPPNGYPDMRGAWQSANPRVSLWRTCNWLMDTTDAADNWRLDVIGQTPGGTRTANEIVDFWIDRVFGRPLPFVDRDEMVEMMAAGHNPDLDLPLDTDESVQNRLRSLVGLMFMSPEFLYR